MPILPDHIRAFFTRRRGALFAYAFILGLCLAIGCFTDGIQGVLKPKVGIWYLLCSTILPMIAFIAIAFGVNQLRERFKDERSLKITISCFVFNSGSHVIEELYGSVIFPDEDDPAEAAITDISKESKRKRARALKLFKNKEELPKRKQLHAEGEGDEMARSVDEMEVVVTDFLALQQRANLHLLQSNAAAAEVETTLTHRKRSYDFEFQRIYIMRALGKGLSEWTDKISTSFWLK